MTFPICPACASRTGRRSRRCHEESGPGSERSRFPNPLFQPNQGRGCRHRHVHHPSAPQFHKHQDVSNRVVPQGLGGQVHGPQLAGMSGQEGVPGGGGSADKPTRSPSPVATIPFSVPLEDRCRRDQHQCGAPPIQVPTEPDPEHSVCRSKQRPGPLPLKHRELVTEDGVFSRQGCVGPSQTREGAEDQKKP